jgi:hypothetical protein
MIMIDHHIKPLLSRRAAKSQGLSHVDAVRSIKASAPAALARSAGSWDKQSPDDLDLS